MFSLIVQYAFNVLIRGLFVDVARFAIGVLRGQLSAFPFLSTFDRASASSILFAHGERNNKQIPAHLDI